jgi:hypothetical protein
MDFSREHERGACMYDDDQDLIAQLCTRIGIIMEDASAIAIDIAGLQGERRSVAIREIAVAAAKIDALSKAINALAS